MYFLDALKLLARRWVVVVVGVLLTAGAGFAVMKMVPTTYQASSQMLILLPPEASGRTTPTNPYLNLQPGQTTTASLVAGTITTKDSQLAMVKAGFPSSYSVALIPGAGPLLVITTKDTDPKAALATRNAVMDRVDAELAQIQSEVSVPKRQMMHTSRSSVSGADVLPGSRLRALMATTAAGGLLILLVAFSLDRLLGRRRATSEVTQDDGSDDGASRNPERPKGPARNGRPKGPARTDRPKSPAQVERPNSPAQAERQNGPARTDRPNGRRKPPKPPQALAG